MIEKAFVETAEGMIARVTFTVPQGIWADSIFLVGDFNDWNRSSHPMLRDRSGRWTITLDLETLHAYEFRYLCDGEWINDNQADAYWHNPHGSHNSVVITDPRFRPIEG